MLEAQKSQLRDLLLRKSVCQGTFTLVSGKTSDFYVDSKLTTLDPLGARLIGEIGWAMIKHRLGDQPARGIGGLTLGADPIALAIGLWSLADGVEQRLQVFAVRKSPKAHGRNKLIEGDFEPGFPVVVVDDVITTGGSTLQAIDAVNEAGGQVALVLVLVDRQEGGREAIEARGYEVLPLFRREDLIGPPPSLVRE